MVNELRTDAALVLAVIALCAATGLAWWIGALIYLGTNIATYLLAAAIKALG